MISTFSVHVVCVALFAIGVSLLSLQPWTAILSSNKSLLSSTSTSTSTLAFHPELYHGEGKTSRFFEGWYHKLVRTRIGCGSSSSNADNEIEIESHRNNNNNDKDNDATLGPGVGAICESESLSMAVVPGVFYDSGNNNNSGNNESHAFIFVTINGEKQHYYRFDLESEFRYRTLGNSPGEGHEHGDDCQRNNDDENENENDCNRNYNYNYDDYYVEIGTNRFSSHGISLDLVPRSGDDASIALRGDVRYLPETLSPWPIPSVRNLGAMGPVGYFLAPFLECHHDVLSFDHKLEGSLTIISNYTSENDDDSDNDSDNSNNDNSNSKVEEFFDTDFCSGDNGDDDDAATTAAAAATATCSSISSRGYVEKDRGRSFPSLWIWMQTNSFRKQPQNSGTSVFFSVARIPILLTNTNTNTNTSVFSTFLGKVLPGSWAEPEFPGFTAAVWLGSASSANANADDDGAAAAAVAAATNTIDFDTDTERENTKGQNCRGSTKRLIPFATWTGAYFEDLVVDEERVVAVLNSGGIGGGLWKSLLSLSKSLVSSRTIQNSAPASRNTCDDVTACSNDSGITTFIRFGRFARAWIGSWFLNYDSRKFRYRLELIADRRVPHVLLYAPKTTTTTSRMEPFVNEALNAKIRVRLYEYEYISGEEQAQVRLLLDDVGEHAGLEVHQNVQYLVENLCGKPTANQFTCL